MTNIKVVLAFSGGLDTSYCALYLAKIKHLEVHAVTVNTGGFDTQELNEIKSRALSLGVKSYTCIDETNNYYQKCIKYLIFGNVLKNNTYPLSVSAERIFQATAIAEYAKSIDAAYIAHGSTGAGNDQVRFDMIFNILIPEIKVMTPIRDLKLSREEEMNFLQENGITIDFEKAKYSINKGLWGTSVGGKETLTSHANLPDEAFPTPLRKVEHERYTLTYKEGELVGVNTQQFENPVHAIQLLQ
ncbi:MAG: argininosuccinate synthase, partial [Bacteroidetes bacterium]|nr:argininosuccinate synthase [Bacteroidota bacterium]